MNEYYNSSGLPASGGVVSLSFRGEYSNIHRGMSKLPRLSLRALYTILVANLEDGLDSLNDVSARSILGVETHLNGNASDGYPFLDRYAISFPCSAETNISLLENSNTAARTYTYPDKSGQVAMAEHISPAGDRNMLINGDFSIWQRGIAITKTTAPGFKADHWYHRIKSGGDSSHSKVTFPTNPHGHDEILIANGVMIAPDDVSAISQPIERVSVWNNASVTVSFKAKTTGGNGNIAISFSRVFDSAEPTVAGIGAQKIAIGPSWEEHNATIALTNITGGPTAGGKNHLLFNMWFSAGSDFDAETDSLGPQTTWFNVTDIQVVSGAVALPYQRRPRSVELKLCQRYCVEVIENWRGTSVGGFTYKSWTEFPVELFMGGTPTVTTLSSVVHGFDAGATTTGVESLGKLEQKECTTTGGTTQDGYYAISIRVESELI